MSGCQVLYYFFKHISAFIKIFVINWFDEWTAVDSWQLLYVHSCIFMIFFSIFMAQASQQVAIVQCNTKNNKNNNFVIDNLLMRPWAINNLDWCNDFDCYCYCSLNLTFLTFSFLCLSTSSYFNTFDRLVTFFILYIILITLLDWLTFFTLFLFHNSELIFFLLFLKIIHFVVLPTPIVGWIIYWLILLERFFLLCVNNFFHNWFIDRLYCNSTQLDPLNLTLDNHTCCRSPRVHFLELKERLLMGVFWR